MSDNDDDEYDVKYDSPKLDADDPKPSLLERRDAEKRTASPSVKNDMPKPRYQKGETLWCYDGSVFLIICILNPFYRLIMIFRTLRWT